MGCGATNAPQPFFCDKSTHCRSAVCRGNHFAGLLTHTLRKFLPRIALPSQFPSDRFSPKDRSISTYSGGTVRDSHPVLLFSFRGHTPGKPRNGLSTCQKNCSMGNFTSQPISAKKKPDAPASGFIFLNSSRRSPVRRSRTDSSDSTGTDWCRGRLPW